MECGWWFASLHLFSSARACQSSEGPYSPRTTKRSQALWFDILNLVCSKNQEQQDMLLLLDSSNLIEPDILYTIPFCDNTILMHVLSVCLLYHSKSFATSYISMSKILWRGYELRLIKNGLQRLRGKFNSALIATFSHGRYSIPKLYQLCLIPIPFNHQKQYSGAYHGHFTH